MAADTLAPSILSFVTDNTYPDSDSLASATLDSSSLAHLVSSLRSAQDEAKDEIRALSRSAGPDIDEWIARAKTLQADILRSRDTARQIVADAEEARVLREQAEEQGRKVGLLEKEVGFNEALAGTLDHVRYANGLLERTQEAAVRGDVEKALSRLEDAEASIAGLQVVKGSRAVELLNQRTELLKENLVETTSECWNALIVVDHDQKKLTVKRSGLQTNVPGAAVPEISLESMVMAAKGLGVFELLVQKLGKDIERVILSPRMNMDDDGVVAKISISTNAIACHGRHNAISSDALFKDLESVLEFLATRLPSVIAIPLSSTFIPALIGRLEEQWLEPSIPLTLAETTSFQAILQNVADLADQISGYGWHGAEQLTEWIENAPRAWLTKRREAVLGDVRNLVFAGLGEREVVERVETRAMKDAEPVAAAKEEDDWDTAWDEPQEEGHAPSKKTSAALQADDEDDASAWELDDDNVDKDDKAEDEDAWGWGDDDRQHAKPPSPVTSKAQPTSTKMDGNQPAPAEQEMTLRETFTTTSIPASVLTILQTLVSDAQTLAADTSSPLAKGSTGLYTLPTLALAIYRATAPTAYSKADGGVGNMLIYNDALRLADLLRSWQASQPAGSKLRMDSDVSALETFAKNAYASEMEAQRTVVQDLLDGAQGFANCTAQPFKGACEGAVQGVVERVRDVQNLWKGVLSEGALLQSLGSLLATVTRKMITEVEELGDIGEAESSQLKKLCENVFELKDIFTTPTSEGGEERDLTFIYCPSWLKFQYLAEILESSLADIRWMWTEGELRLEFEADEVVELVEALFAESELRRQAVREIRRA